MTLSFRLLKRSDMPLMVKWLNTPHVQKWWREQATPERVEEKYRASIDGKESTSMYMMEADGQPIGIMQSYMVEDYPEHAQSVQIEKAVGIDLFIGEKAYIGRSIGPALLSEFISQIVPEKYPQARGVVADPQVENAVSIRAFEKAGFKKMNIVSGEHGPEQIMYFSFEC